MCTNEWLVQYLSKQKYCLEFIILEKILTYIPVLSNPYDPNHVKLHDVFVAILYFRHKAKRMEGLQQIIFFQNLLLCDLHHTQHWRFFRILKTLINSKVNFVFTPQSYWWMFCIAMDISCFDHKTQTRAANDSIA